MWEPEHKEMTAASKSWPLLKLHCRGCVLSRTSQVQGEAEALREETGICTGGKGRGMGPSTYTRIMEITSGRTVCQQGLAATCKDSSVEAEAIVGERHSVLRMSQYERRRPGNAGREGAGHPPEEGHTRLGRRGSRYVADSAHVHRLGTEPDCDALVCVVEPEV